MATIMKTQPGSQDRCMLDRLRQAGTEADYIKAGEALQEYATEQMMYYGVASLPNIGPLETI